jgi:uncharacterized protein YhaN
MRERLMETRQSQLAARQAFEAVGGDDGAARASAERQSALAEMKDIAEQYVRLRSTAILLQWAIDRYRREKQAPLLQRAGQLFSILTGNSFTDLQLEFDQNDNARLAGIRHDGKGVSVTGMSTGSADQLYLALRVAAIEDYLDHAPPLPFILTLVDWPNVCFARRATVRLRRIRGRLLVTWHARPQLRCYHQSYATAEYRSLAHT